MKLLLPLALLSLATSAFAAEHVFYLGTYTGPKSQGVYRGTLDSETGKLGPLEIVAEAKNPSFVALSPSGKTLYACVEAEGGAVGAWSIGADGKLAPLGTKPSQGKGACHVWVDATGKNVLTANYGSGSVAAFPVNPDGSLRDASATHQHEGSGPNEGRQKGPHAHSIYTDASNKFVYSCDLGTDDVFIYRFDAEKGTLTLNDPKSGRVPAGSGPRHFAFHPKGGFAYANNEMALTVTAFKHDAATGGLTEIQTISTMPEGAERKGVSTAEIFTHPNGKWLYVSNRGHNTIAVFAIGADGKLTPVEHVQVPAVPRGFALSPDGEWLISGGQDSNQIAVFKVDPATGKLKANGQTAEVGSPVCVLFAK